jgi:acetoin utilization protein AcuB
MHVRDYMTTSVVTANLRDGLRQTFYRMRERGVRHMPVLDGKERLVGIVSDRDLRRPGWVDAEENVAHYYLLDNATKVEDAMTPKPVTVTGDTPMADALAIFLARRFGAVPVVDDERRVIGIISAYDVLRAFADTLKG